MMNVLVLLYFTGNISTRSTPFCKQAGTCVFKIRTPSDVIGNNPHLFSSENLPSAVDTAVFLGRVRQQVRKCRCVSLWAYNHIPFRISSSGIRLPINLPVFDGFQDSKIHRPLCDKINKYRCVLLPFFR